jgi:hypothetical protein
MFAVALATAVIEALIDVLLIAGALVASIATLATIVAKTKGKQIRQITK